MKRLLIYITIVIVFSESLLSQSDSLQSNETNKFYSADNILLYADYLWQKEDYIRSAGEYQRYLFTKSKKREMFALFQIAKCFRRAELFENSLEYLEKAIQRSENKDLKDSLSIALSATHLLTGIDEKFFQQISLHKHSKSRYILKEAAILESLYLLKKNNWESAYSILSDSLFNISSSLSILPLLEIAKKGVNMNTKSPILSGIFSAIIPGSGKIYANRTIDGLYSFLLVGGSSWLAYDGFRNGGSNSAKGWIFGSLSTLLYAGNIYGSVIAVEMYNNHQKEKLLDEIQFQINIYTYF